MTAPGAGASHGYGRGEVAAAVALMGVGLAVALILGLLGDGVYQDDDIAHFLFARDAWDNTESMLHWWARPGYNLPTMLAAPFGLDACRALSALQTAGVALLAWLIARRVGVGRWWSLAATLFVWAQPLVMTLAETTLTETPAALYLTLGTWLYLRGNRVWGAVAVSPAFVTRLETLALAPVFVAALAWDAWRAADGRLGPALRRYWLWGSAACLLWAPAAYCLAAWLVDLPAASSPLYIFLRGHSAAYGRGAWHHYAVRWAQASSVGIAALALAGAVRLGRRAALVTALALGLVVLQGMIFSFGLFASGGYARFLVPVGGLVAVLAAGGIRCLWRGESRLATSTALVAAPVMVVLVGYLHPGAVARSAAQAHALSWCVATVCAVLLVLALVTASTRRYAAPLSGVLLLMLAAAQVGAQVRPLWMDNNVDGMHRAVLHSVDQLRRKGLSERRALTQHVLICYLHDNAKKVGGHEALRRWRAAPPGTLFYWDSKYCATPGSPAAQSALYAALQRGGRLVAQASCAGCHVEVYARTGDAPPGERASASTVSPN
ncbi:MAG: hypothetical protein KGY99_00660 [Phycisphaerae bacterium]|nr:hypothetical protein [Phycisphaerae bacterium]